MQIKLKHTVFFNDADTIVTASLSNPDTIIILMSSGEVIKYNIKEEKQVFLFSVKSNIGYEDGGFDLNTKATIYTLDEIIVIVNNFKTHGFIHYPGKYDALHLWREDYYAENSSYPIALFKDKKDVPYIIYSVAWNHLQIMNLDTRQILTASKSLIEKNAEKKHIDFYKNHVEHNKLPWPHKYDYFFGELLLSPNNKKFLSAGWSWGSSDNYKIYDINNFIKSKRISDINLGFWEHLSRAVCWIDKKNIAVTYNPYEEGDENSTIDSPSEIHFYKLGKQKTSQIRKIKVPKEIIDSSFHFNTYLNSFVAFSKKMGLKILSLHGQIIFENESFKVNSYNNNFNLLLTIDNNKIIINEIIL